LKDDLKHRPMIELLNLDRTNEKISAIASLNQQSSEYVEAERQFLQLLDLDNLDR
jgi:hypothetical protein